jgi:hypothetical protein
MTDQNPKEPKEQVEVEEPKAPKAPKAPKKITKVSKEVVAAPVVAPVVAPVAAAPAAPKNQFQPAGRVKEIKGSILSPHNAGLRFILNIANMTGKAESPLYPLFEKKWPKVKQEVRGWFNTRTGAYKLGAVNSVATQSDTWVLNCLCQDAELKTDLAALEVCLKEVCKMAKYERATIHISSLLVDAIPELSNLAHKYLVEEGISVSYYEEPANK